MFKDQDSQIFCLKLNKYMSNFYPLEVVDRGSETQSDVVENVKDLIYLFRVAVYFYRDIVLS